MRLTISPGRVIREYLAGRTVVYVHPFAYLPISFVAFALVYNWRWGTTGGSDWRVFLGAIVIFLAAASRLVFWRAGLNYAEHLVLNMFLFAHMALLLTGALILTYPVPDSAAWIVLIVAALAACTYMLWSYTRVFSRRPILAALGGLLVMAIAAGAWLGAIIVIVRVASR